MTQPLPTRPFTTSQIGSIMYKCQHGSENIPLRGINLLRALLGRFVEQLFLSIIGETRPYKRY